MERERENHFSLTKTYRILSSPQTCAGIRNMKQEQITISTRDLAKKNTYLGMLTTGGY
jgi:hypothetical protein